jgi:ATP-dependent DNA helicase DinG
LCVKIKNAIYGSIKFSEDTQKYSVPITNVARKQLFDLSEKLVQANQMQVAPSRQLLHLAKNIMRFLNAEQITYVEREGKKDMLIGVPTEIDKLIKRDLFDGKIGVIMTSGTMAVDNDFAYTKGLLGLNDTARKLVYVVKPSPFDYIENSLIFTSTHTVYPNYENEIYFKTLAGEVDKLIRASHGHALVLFTSYRAMRTVYELLRKRDYPFPLFKTNKGGGRAIIDFKKSDNAVLLGCGALWEGMNFEGDKLSHLIITKLPFLIPGPITEYKRSQMESEDEYRQEILIPQMLLKLKQGHGRAIRTDTDTAVISILDCRVNTHYKKPVQNALPECRYTSDIEDVARFFREKKTDEYFGRYANGRIRVN